ncbi:MAG: hypothetical protein VB139_08820 [Coriobacteriia bacterium]|nr:hypothetical protein [Coriobacteriia bacterium]
MVRDEKLLTDELTEAISGAAEPLSASARAKVRERVMHEVSATSRGGILVLASHRLAVAGTALAVGFGGVAYAAERSLPGDPLYGVKIAAENAVVAVLPPGRLENHVLVSIAARRAGEAATLAREGSGTDAIDEALGSLRKAVRDAAPAEGSLTTDEANRIRQRAADAPAETRDAIEQAVVSPGPADGGASGSETGGAPGTGTGGSPRSGSDDGSGGIPDAGADDSTGTGEPDSTSQQRTREGQGVSPTDTQSFEVGGSPDTERTREPDGGLRSK